MSYSIPLMFGRKIRRLRTRLKLTQTALAERAGLSQAFVHELEFGEKQPSVKTLRALSRVLKVPVWELLQ